MSTTKPPLEMLDIPPLPAAGVCVDKGSSYSATEADSGDFHRCTSALAIALPLVADVDNSWNLTVIAAGGDVAVNPSGADTINGAATLVVRNGSWALVYCNGSAFFSIGIPTSLWGSFTFNGPMTINGDLTVNGSVTATG